MAGEPTTEAAIRIAAAVTQWFAVHELVQQPAPTMDTMRALITTAVFDAAVKVLTPLQAHITELEQEDADMTQLMDRLSGLLSRTALALKGPEPELTKWSWHDLPEVAEQMVARVAELDAETKELHGMLDEVGL